MQTGSVDRVEFGTVHDRRGVTALAVVAALLVVALVWIATGAPAVTGGPLAAVAAYRTELDCESGTVVPDTGESALPVDHDHAGSVLGPGGALTVTLQGLANRSVVIQGATARIERRQHATRGMFLEAPCGSSVDPRYFTVDLDRPRPELKAEPGSVTFPFRVNDVEPEQFVIKPAITEGYVEWRLVVRWSSGEDTGELVVGDGDRPFRTTSLTAVTRRLCVDDTLTRYRPC